MGSGSRLAVESGEGEDDRLTEGHEIQVLRKAGHSLPEVGRLAGVSVRSVQRVEAEPAVSHVDELAERVRRKIGRPSTARPLKSSSAS